ncbi:MAG: hypothetical protein WCF57_05155 [Pyrinomonadaceae bacterium]
MKKKAGSKRGKVSQVEDDNARRVTPNDPLVTNQSQASYPHVIIEGGDILVIVETTVTFERLEKTK